MVERKEKITKLDQSKLEHSLKLAFERAQFGVNNKSNEKWWRLLNTMEPINQAASSAFLIINGIFSKNCVLQVSNGLSRPNIGKSKIVLNIANHLTDKILLISELLREKTKSPELNDFLDGLKKYRKTLEAQEPGVHFNLYFFKSIEIFTKKTSVLMKGKDDKFINCFIKEVSKTNPRFDISFNENDFLSYLDEVLECFLGQPEIVQMAQNNENFKRLINNKTAKYMFFFNPNYLKIETIVQLDSFLTWFLSSALGKSEINFDAPKFEKRMETLEQSDSRVKGQGSFFTTTSVVELNSKNESETFKLNPTLLACRDTKKVKQFLKKEGLNPGEKIDHFNSALWRLKDTPIINSVVYLMSYLAFIFEDKEVASCVEALAPGFKWQCYKPTILDDICITALAKNTCLRGFLPTQIGQTDGEMNPIIGLFGKYVNMYCSTGLLKKCVLAHQIHNVDRCFESGLHLNLKNNERKEMFLKFIFDRQIQLAQYLINKENEIDCLTRDGQIVQGQNVGIKEVLCSPIEISNKEHSGFSFDVFKGHIVLKKEALTLTKWKELLVQCSPVARGGAVLSFEAPESEMKNNVFIKRWTTNLEAALLDSSIETNIEDVDILSTDNNVKMGTEKRRNRL